MKKYTIAIVENDEDEQFFMKEGFERSGNFTIAAVFSNGNELMNWLHAQANNLPDIILSDLNMPGKNGYDIITEIKETPALSHIPVIITSTSSTKTFIDKCMALGAADYLVKPETFVDYLPFVENLYAVINSKSLVRE
jgi:CheY-like chemotaxis protein